MVDKPLDQASYAMPDTKFASEQCMYHYFPSPWLQVIIINDPFSHFRVCLLEFPYFSFSKWTYALRFFAFGS